MRPPPIPGLLLALAVLVTGAVALHSCTGCAPLTPGAASAIEGTVAALCPLEAALPVVGTFAALACPGEEAALATALAAVEVQPAPTAAPLVPVYRVAAGQLRHVGSVHPSHARAVQRALLATATSSRRTSTSALPPAPAVLPTLDGGAEGGRP